MNPFAEVEAEAYDLMRRPTQSTSPEIRRRKSAKVKKWVFLDMKIWEELTRAASFATTVFVRSGRGETVSRNDFIEDSLVWALAAYWKDKGGIPETDEEFELLAQAAGDRLRKREGRDEPAAPLLIIPSAQK